MSNQITGTVAELVAKRLTFNGVLLGQPEVSTLTRLGLGNKLGTVPRPAGTKGKPATIWGFNTGTLDAAFGVAPAGDPASAVATDAVNTDESAANDAENVAEETAAA